MSNPVKTLVRKELIEARATNGIEIFLKVCSSVLPKVRFRSAMIAAGVAFGRAHLKHFIPIYFVTLSTDGVSGLVTIANNEPALMGFSKELLHDFWGPQYRKPVLELRGIILCHINERYGCKIALKFARDNRIQDLREPHAERAP